MKQFTKRDAEIVLQIFDLDFISHFMATELSWHAEHAEDKKDRDALKIVLTYFGGNSE